MKNVKIAWSAGLFCAALSLILNANAVIAQVTNAKHQAPSRAVPPTRDPQTSGYVVATELPDGDNPSPGTDGNFIIGPTHNPAPEMIVQDNVPRALYIVLP